MTCRFTCYTLHNHSSEVSDGNVEIYLDDLYVLMTGLSLLVMLYLFNGALIINLSYVLWSHINVFIHNWMTYTLYFMQIICSVLSGIV